MIPEFMLLFKVMFWTSFYYQHNIDQYHYLYSYVVIYIIYFHQRTLFSGLGKWLSWYCYGIETERPLHMSKVWIESLY